MDGANIVALVSVVVSGLVGFGAPYVTEKLNARREAQRAERERSRQERQFLHEHELRDAAELRAVLDEASAKMEAGYRASLDLIADFKLRARPDEAEVVIASVRRAQEAANATEGIAARLAIRLGPTHAIPTLCNDASLSCRAVVDAIIAGMQEGVFEASKADDAAERAAEVSGAFLRHARQLAGTRLLPTPPSQPSLDAELTTEAIGFGEAERRASPPTL
jgi:hypothetical protein